jgi:hydroxymethylbilane synthase
LLRLATRGSQLARWQASHVAALLQSAHPGLEVELVIVSTTGDRRADIPVWEMGGRGVFVREVQAAVLGGQADAAVHSAKDLQPSAEKGLRLAAVPERADPRDALVGATLADLGHGAVVATGSQRRRAQLASLRPDLCFQSLRGNIETRLSRVPSGGAIVVAMAALERLGLRPRPMETLGTDVMLPQVAQGAIGVECREADAATIDLMDAINHMATWLTVNAERAFLATVGGACDLPVAGYATLQPEGSQADGLALEGLLAAPDGSEVVRRRASGPGDDPVALGRQVAELVLAGGGRGLLAAHRQRP